MSFMPRRLRYSVSRYRVEALADESQAVHDGRDDEGSARQPGNHGYARLTADDLRAAAGRAAAAGSFNDGLPIRVSLD